MNFDPSEVTGGDLTGLSYWTVGLSCVISAEMNTYVYTSAETR